MRKDRRIRPLSNWPGAAKRAYSERFGWRKLEIKIRLGGDSTGRQVGQSVNPGGGRPRSAYYGSAGQCTFRWRTALRVCVWDACKSFICQWGSL